MTGSDPVDEAAAAALGGKLIVFPTDTVYGLGTRPDDPAATARVFEAKRRPEHLELPVLVATPAQARSVAAVDDRAERLIAACWPGALTLVLPRSQASAAWQLGGDATTVGVRMPAHPVALAVLARTGPLAVTSANRSGDPPARTRAELRATFGDGVSVYLCTDEPLEGAASTVLDLCREPARILRAGSLPPDRLAELIGEPLDSPTSR